MKVIKDGKAYNGTITVDGYFFGDRMLEGVFFELDVNNGNIDKNSFRLKMESDKEYFEMFNQEYWKNTFFEYVKDLEENGYIDFYEINYE